MYAYAYVAIPLSIPLPLAPLLSSSTSPHSRSLPPLLPQATCHQISIPLSRCASEGLGGKKRSPINPARAGLQSTIPSPPCRRHPTTHLISSTISCTPFHPTCPFAPSLPPPRGEKRVERKVGRGKEKKVRKGEIGKRGMEGFIIIPPGPGPHFRRRNQQFQSKHHEAHE